MRIRTITLASSVLAAALVLAGCSTNSDMGGMDGMGHSSTPTSPSNTGSFNNADETFLMEMIPHHQQAIEMADMLLEKEGVDASVSELALRIKQAQGPEIETMTNWLEDWGYMMDDS